MCTQRQAPTSEFHRKATLVSLALLTVLALTAGCGRLRERRQEAPTVTPEASAAVATFTPTPMSTPVTSGAAASSAIDPQTFVELVAADADVFNPVLTNSSTSTAVLGMIYPRLVGQDAQTGVIVPNEMATRWDISADGRVYTFTLRSDVFWNDGQPVTSEDFRYTYEALAAADALSPAADRLDGIAEIAAPEPYTLVLRLAEADCSVLQRLWLPWLPSHRYAADYADLAANPLNEQPIVSAGPFRFVEWTPQEQIVLEADPAHRRVPSINRYVLRVEPDAGERLRLAEEGLADLIWVSATELDAAQGLAGMSVVPYPARSVDYMALNLADANSPQAGQDANGNRIPQQPHPILGDTGVRRALAFGLDIERIRMQAYGAGSFTPVGTVLSSVTWAHASDLAPYGYQAQAAVDALEAAGWVDADGDGVRERNGVRLVLSVLTNEENAVRRRAADLIAAQLGELGIESSVQRLPYDEMAARVLAQRFDLALLGWENLPADPGLLPLWRSVDDVPGAGVNFTSFQDAEVDAWLDAAQTVPGCDLGERGDLYRQVQRRVHERLPVIYLQSDSEAWLAAERWSGVTPGAFGRGDVSAWRSSQ